MDQIGLIHLKNIFRRLDFSWLFGKWIEGPLLDFKPKGDGFLLLSIVSSNNTKIVRVSENSWMIVQEWISYQEKTGNIWGGASLTFQSSQLPWLPTKHSCFLRLNSARGQSWHMAFVALLTLKHGVFLSLHLLLFILHCCLFRLAFYFTLTLALVSVYEISVFHSVDHSWLCSLRSITFYWAFMSRETALHFNKVSNPLGPSPLKQLQLPRAAEELSRESRSFCGQWCWWQITPAVITRSSR